MTTNHEGGAGTLPTQPQTQDAASPHLVITPYVHDERSGAIWVHKDYMEVRPPWEDITAQRNYLAPVKAAEQFGDVASWAAYVQRFGDPLETLLTWNSGGLRAVLDYHHESRDPGRCQWTAEHKFTLSRQLSRWQEFASGEPREQRRIIEFLEDMADTVVEPSAATLTGILSTLRASVGSNATSILEPDGGYRVEFIKDAKVTGSGRIPPTFVIRVPVLVGHTNEDGSPVVYDLTVRLRVTPTEQGAVFRLSIPNLSTTLEDAYTDRVQAARAALPDGYEILRVADSK